MASEDTLIGNDLRVQVGDGNSPEVFADLCSAIDFGALGEQKPLINVTALCDAAQKFRNGLAEGVEIPLQLNFIQGDLQIRALKTDYDNDTIRNFRIALVDASPEEYFEFAATINGWSLSGPINDRATVTFTLKVTGEVDWVYA